MTDDADTILPAVMICMSYSIVVTLGLSLISMLYNSHPSRNTIIWYVTSRESIGLESDSTLVDQGFSCRCASKHSLSCLQNVFQDGYLCSPSLQSSYWPSPPIGLSTSHGCMVASYTLLPIRRPQRYIIQNYTILNISPSQHSISDLHYSI